MSRYTDDRLLWLTVATGLALACLYIPATLKHVRTITEVPDDEDETKKLTHDAEAALTPDALKVLADGPSYELRASAIKIIIARSLKDETRQILLRDIASPQAAVRGKALDAVHMIISSVFMPNDTRGTDIPAFADTTAFTAIVDALINCLPLHDIVSEPQPLRKPTQISARGLSNASPLLPPNRPADEKRLLEILFEALKYVGPGGMGSNNDYLRAGVIKRWLNQYPFPCANPSNSHLGFCRSDVVSLFSLESWATDDPPMARVMAVLKRDAEALKQFRECGLLASNYKEAVSSGQGNAEWSELPVRDIVMTNSEDTAGLWNTERPGSSWARQAPDRSPEEDNLRRRHREAIVVAERGTPISRENILQRQNSRVGLMPLSEPAQELLRVFNDDGETPLRSDEDHANFEVQEGQA